MSKTLREVIRDCRSFTEAPVIPSFVDTPPVADMRRLFAVAEAAEAYFDARDLAVRDDDRETDAYFALRRAVRGTP